METPKILFKLPSRGRPERLFRSIDSIFLNIANDAAYHISCTLDVDDFSLNTEAVKERLAGYKNLSVEWGYSTSKIHAINRSMPDIEWDILVQTSDDILFSIYGFDEMIRMEMLNYFPEGDGYLHFREKDSLEALNVMTVIDKKYFERFGYIYHPSYKSLFCDNEQMESAKILGRYKYIPYEIFNHYNPAYGYAGFEKDTMFLEQQEIGWTIDHRNFIKRKAINFEL